jgi:L-rhamnose mutarotase
MPRLHFALDLRDDPVLIAEYEAWHRPQTIWPEIPQFLRAAGVREMEIFRCGDRLVMAMDVAADYCAVRQAQLGSTHARVRDWEKLMSKYQRSLPFARAGEKWVSMVRVFSLREALGEEEQGT